MPGRVARKNGLAAHQADDWKSPFHYFYLSNAPLSTRLTTFVWLSGSRWAIEQRFEEAKTELGMNHYEVRKYPADPKAWAACLHRGGIDSARAVTLATLPVSRRPATNRDSRFGSTSKIACPV